MFLKRIEINGFKSFANKTQILLNNRITGIVGPNGSGKSNIADAIRWVLGEQSSKNLRGTKMEDVIFNGTQTRPKKPFCEVSLIFDNEDGKIASDYTEITITRRMYRSGESEYKLNNSLVRLKDIIDITRDTGIGKEGYSIIGQGKIDEILSSKPLQRRKVFEEAAGIMKYRARKEEAEKNLQKTDENLTRAEDILEELLVRLEPLEKQAEQTKKYNAYFERLRTLDANVFILNNDRFKEKCEKLSCEISETDAHINRIMREYADVAQKMQELNDELDAAIEEENGYGEKTSEIIAEIERLSGEAKLTRERMVNLESDAKRLKEEISLSEQENEKARKAMEINDGKLLEISEEMALCEDDIQKTEKDRQALLNVEESRQNKISEAKTKQLDVLSQLSSRTSERARLEAQSAGIDGRKEELLERITRVKEDMSQRQALQKKGNERLAALKEQKAGMITALNENSFVISSAKKKAAEIEERNNRKKAEITDLKGRLKLLCDLKNEYDGYNDSVKSLMRELKDKPELKKRVIGTVAELISVPKQYETAIETYLGASLQNIVVNDEYEAKALIEFLREKKLGRVTFLPLNALKVTRFSGEELETLKRCEGFICCAHEAVNYDKSVGAAVEFLLSKTALTKDLDSSINIMRKTEQSIKTVTLLGDITRPGGVMTGGSVNRKSFGLLSRDRVILKTKEQVEIYEAEQREIEEELLKINEELTVLKKKGEEATQRLKEKEIAFAEETQRVSSYTSLIEGCEINLRSLNNQLQVIDKDKENAKLEADKLTQLIEYLENQKAEADAALLDLEKTSNVNAKELNELNEALSDKKIRRAELNKEKQAFLSENERLAQENKAALNKAQSKRDSLSGCLNRKNILEEELSRNIENKNEKEEELLALRDSGKQAEENRKQLRSLVLQNQQAVNDFQEEKTALTERRLKLDAQLDKVKTALETAQTKLWEDYELTYTSALSLKEEISYSAAVKEAEGVRLEIRKLGSINPNAIEEYNELKARTDDMLLQKEDLIHAKEDLFNVIDGLTNSMRETFAVKFEQINENFARIFSELFGGGTAKIYFEEGDLLEAGIEISVEPPGKKMQPLSLYSGGERALTAIALLFAMIRINPSPVCLLDEIDAPLDEANAVRFGDYLKKITETQFMVITHRKPTMTSCNALYGVTMEEKGVSRMVSVQIDKN